MQAEALEDSEVEKVKKTYSKPQIAIENYYLSEMISGCTFQAVFSTNSGCGNNLDPSIDALLDKWKQLGVFNQAGNCTLPADDIPDSDLGFCYHTSTSNNVFGS